MYQLGVHQRREEHPSRRNMWAKARRYGAKFWGIQNVSPVWPEFWVLGRGMAWSVIAGQGGTR